MPETGGSTNIALLPSLAAKYSYLPVLSPRAWAVDVVHGLPKGTVFTMAASDGLGSLGRPRNERGGATSVNTLLIGPLRTSNVMPVLSEGLGVKSLGSGSEGEGGVEPHRGDRRAANVESSCPSADEVEVSKYSALVISRTGG